MGSWVPQMAMHSCDTHPKSRNTFLRLLGIHGIGNWYQFGRCETPVHGMRPEIIAAASGDKSYRSSKHGSPDIHRISDSTISRLMRFRRSYPDAVSLDNPSAVFILRIWTGRCPGDHVGKTIAHAL